MPRLEKKKNFFPENIRCVEGKLLNAFFVQLLYACFNDYEIWTLLVKRL